MSTTDYHRLGDYIREVNCRNTDLKVKKLLGVSMSKEFIVSIANIIGTDMTSYKVVAKNQFAYGPVTSRNGDKVSIALFNEQSNAIVSQAYTIFEIIDHNKLMPEYLMMWFRRPEFDSYARFKSHGSAREIFDLEEMSNMLLPIPSIEKQKKIVSQYETLSKRIALNEKLCKNLEATAQALYRKMFVDDIDKENLPEGWRWGTLNEVAEIKMGQSPNGDSYNNNGNGEIFYQGNADFGQRFPAVRVYSNSPNRMARQGDILLSVRAPVGDINITLNDCCIGRGLASLRSKNHCNSYVFYTLKTLKNIFEVSDDEGTVFGSISKDNLKAIDLIIPNEESMKEFENNAFVIDTQFKVVDREINQLKEMQSLLLAKM